MIVKTQELTRTYRLGASVIVAVSKVNLENKDATFVSIVGPSGSGKTTLLNLIGLNDHPTSGKVFFKNQNTSLLTDKKRRKIRLQNIGFVFQMFHLIPYLNLVENVLLARMCNNDGTNYGDKANKLLDRLGLGGRKSHRPAQLSAGEKQRAAIAEVSRMLVHMERRSLAV